jgi:spoIIIJ-associated protein
MADKAKTTKHPVALEPMLPFERKIIHEALAENKAVETSSSGEEPNRYILIKPKK